MAKSTGSRLVQPSSSLEHPKRLRVQWSLTQVMKRDSCLHLLVQAAHHFRLALQERQQRPR
eukprot:3494464-Amphidinium_carterae.1